MLKKFIPTIIASSLVIAGCASTTTQQQATKFSPRAENPFLSMEQAQNRSSRVSNVDYQLHFDLTGEETFAASSEISFTLNDASTPLTVDLDKAKITSLVVNGKDIKPDYNQWFITIPAENLIKGNNTVKVSFTRPHSTNGEGLHRFKDPVDGKVYLYSHFEPAAAHQMFALFDQPDLKAQYAMTVTTPADWQVISATKETSFSVVDNKKYWVFDKTLKLSPYNFSMHAGPYKVWQDTSGKYPMRLLVRQSVAKQVNPSDWFKYTKEGINFFENYYGVDYPFRKYDQILVPDFLYGAMENAAAITFAERGFLTNGAMSASQKQRLASVILHEMAHQWFGNLVTMKWWNALWLNESFAAFMQTMATAEATEFSNAWRSFYAGGKQAAYRQDQRITTHPIEVPVPSTANAFDNIDAITYSKGASTLNQLRHLLGDEIFRRGIHNYLTKYAYKNAELDDFIGTLAQTSGKNLDEWKQQWLYKAGVNTITANYHCEQGKITDFSLLQKASEKFPTLREQRVQVALFNVDKNKLTLNKNVAITYKGTSTAVEQLVGATCPDLVYPNYQDWGFVKANLDQKSFATAKRNLANVDDALLRSMLWQSLYDSVQDGQLPLNEYLDIAIANISKETDYTILGQALRQIASARSNLVKMLGANNPSVQKYTESLAQLSWENVQKNANDSNKLRRWFSYYQSFSITPKRLTHLANILSGKEKVKNLQITQDMRWSLISTLSRYQYANAAQLIEKELANDSSDTGQKAAIFAKVIVPDAQVKKEWLAKIQAEKSSLSFSKLRTAMSALYPPEQLELSKLTAKQRIDSLAAIDKVQGPVFMRSYNGLIPNTCDKEGVDRLEQAIKTQTGLSAGTKRRLLVTHQETERCVMMKSKLTIK